jgi:hypothetical protein
VKGPFDRHFVDVHAAGGRQTLVSQLAGRGLATFDGMRTPSELLALARSVGDVVPHRDSDRDGVTTLAGAERSSRPLPGYLGFSAKELVPHTDGSSVASPPPLVMLACAVPAPHGGETLVVDGAEIYDRLRHEAPAVLQQLSQPRSARFGAEEGYLGSIFEYVIRDQPDSDGRMSVRFRWDGLSAFAPPTAAVLPQFLDLVREVALEFALHSGQGYLVQNGRWLHGRRAYRGYRCAYRILIRSRTMDSLGGAVPCGFVASS